MILNELKNNILSNEDFNKQRMLLSKLALLKNMGIKNDLGKLEEKEIIQLIESANILSQTDDIDARVLAYKIITDIYYIYSETYPRLKSILYMVLKILEFMKIKQLK